MGAATAREMHGRGTIKLALMSPSESCEDAGTPNWTALPIGARPRMLQDTLSRLSIWPWQTYGRIDACLIHVGGRTKRRFAGHPRRRLGPGP